MHTGEYKWYHKDLSALREIKRDEMKIEYKERLFKKYKTEKKGNLDQVIEKLKHKMSAKTQLFSRYWKRQNQYYQNKMFRKTAGNFTERYQCENCTN